MLLAINLIFLTIVYLCNNLCPQQVTPATHHNNNALCRNMSQPGIFYMIEKSRNSIMGKIMVASNIYHKVCKDGTILYDTC